MSNLVTKNSNKLEEILEPLGRVTSWASLFLPPGASLLKIDGLEIGIGAGIPGAIYTILTFWLGGE